MALLEEKGTGQWGHCPDWYDHIQLARYLGVPPWDLAGLPWCPLWREWTRAAMQCEAEAHAEVKRYRS